MLATNAPTLAAAAASLIRTGETPAALALLDDHSPAISRITVKWVADTDSSMTGQWYDDAVKTRPNTTSREYGSEIDFPATLAYLLNEAGAPAEGENSAYKQAAYIARRFELWQEGRINFAGCVVTAYASTPATPEIITEIESASVWGIETDADKAYQAETIKDQRAELQSQLEAAGWDVSKFDELETTEDDGSQSKARRYGCSDDYAYMSGPIIRMEDIDPIPASSEYFQWDARNSNQYDGFYTCAECGEEFDDASLTPEQINTGECPNIYCVNNPVDRASEAAEDYGWRVTTRRDIELIAQYDNDAPRDVLRSQLAASAAPYAGYVPGDFNYSVIFAGTPAAVLAEIKRREDEDDHDTLTVSE